MPERTRHAPGTPSWTDCQTTDQNDAKQFYGELFGWAFDDQPAGPDATYSMAVLNGKYVCAIAPQPPDQAAMGVPPHWGTYVTVADVDATAAAISAAGGTVLAPGFDVMDAGRMAVAVDPTGAVFQIWQPKNHIGAQLLDEPNTMCWNELMTPGVDAAIEFYGKIFGWAAQTHDGAMPYTEFSLDGRSIAGAMKPPMEGMPPAWGVYFAVADADATAARAQSLGGAVLNGPADIRPGRFAVLTDRQGAAFMILALNEPGD
jgi:hypothetical protein